MHLKKLFSLLVSLMVVSSAVAQLNLKDLTDGKYRPVSPDGVNPMADGESYARIEDDKRIVRCSFKDGKVEETLFDVNDVRGRVHIDEIDDYIISPKGDNILVETEHEQIYRRSGKGKWYIYSIKNKTLEPLSDGDKQEQPLWSPDGYMVAFVREGNLFLVKLLFNNSESQITKDGEMNRVINGKPDWVYEEEFVFTRAFCFTADASMLCWIRFDESKVPLYSFPLYKGLKPEREQYLAYPGRFEYKYPMAGEVNSTLSVHSFDIKSRVTRKLQLPVEADGYVPRIMPTEQPEKIVCLTQNRHQDQLSVYVCNPRSTECRLVLTDDVKPYIGETVYGNFRVVSDGFVYMSEKSGTAQLYHCSINGGAPRALTSGELPVVDFYGYDARTGNTYYSAKDGGPLREAVYVSDSKGKAKKLSQQEGVNSAVFSANFKYFYNEWSNLDTPPVYSLCDGGNGKALKVLEVNSALRDKLAPMSLGKREFFSFTTSEGVTLNGWMVKPAGFSASKKYPVVMFQYSGPGAQQVVDAWSAGNMGGCLFEQYLAQEGFLCVCVDGRGTGGRGARFEKQTYQHLGLLEAKDQVEAALWLGQQSYVDKKRIGIWGWSYGGYITLMSMSEGRPVFAAGVAVAPVTCYRYYDTIYTERFMRTPKENPEGYGDNPITRASKLSGRLLICQGTADDNVHYRNVAEYAEALVQADKDFYQIDFTNRNHGISGGNTRNFLFRQITQWFKAM